jgi:hypothetical protein
MAEIPAEPAVDDLLADLRVLRERGLVRLRHTDLAVLRSVAAQLSGSPSALGSPAASSEPAGQLTVEAVLRAAVESLGGGELGAAASATFGLDRGARDRPAADRRRRAAQVYGVSVERFRKHHERIVIEQVAEEILVLLTRSRPSARPQGIRPEPSSQTILSGGVRGTDLRIVIRTEPVELLSDVDIVVVPTNSYLELPQYFKSSISATVRRMAAVKNADGQVVVDVVADDLTNWISKYGRPGLPVAAGTVAPTASGEMTRQRIRRLYHVAVVTPRPSTNDYIVEPAAIAEGVRNVFAIAAAERALFSPPLRSVAFPLLGAGRGGLDPAVSFDWLWSALQHEIVQASLWELQFFARQQVLADLIITRLAAAGLVVT